MALTIGDGPLSGDSGPTNYEIEGPKHKLYLHAFPRRIRAVFGDETVLDSREAMLLDETGLLPRIYVPVGDVRTDLLERTDHSTHCPFKGVASYWTVRAGDKEAENAVWAYEDPNSEASWLEGYMSFHFDAMDEWLDEDEPIETHVRDPYHRVDVRRSSLHVAVTVAGETIAETDRPMVLSETGIPNRFYIPPQDVRVDLLETSETTTHCPYKGTTEYRHARIGDRLIEDVAWVYPDPFEDALKTKDHLSFDGDDVEIEVSGEGATATA